MNNVYKQVSSARSGCTIYGLLVRGGGGEGGRIGGGGEEQEALFGPKGN